jgi:hypothetical protein
MLWELDPIVMPRVPENPRAAVLDDCGELKLSCACASCETDTLYEPAWAELVVEPTTAELDDEAVYEAYCVGSASAVAADWRVDMREENCVMVCEALEMLVCSVCRFVSGMV